MKFFLLYAVSLACTFSVLGITQPVKDTLPHHYSVGRGRCLVSFKTGIGIFADNPPFEMHGVSYRVIPELEYLFLKRFSASLALNYFNSRYEDEGENELMIHKSVYAGLKAYIPISGDTRKNHMAALHLGAHYGNVFFKASDTFSSREYTASGISLSFGAGYQNFPRKLFGSMNSHWAYYLDLSFPFVFNGRIEFSYGGIGVKYILK